MKGFIIQNWDTLITFIGIFFSSIRGIYQFFLSQKKDVEIKNLESKLEIIKTQSILNDNKFREGYEHFLNIMMDEINKGKNLGNTEKGMIKFMKMAILFAGPETIKAFGSYRKSSSNLSNNNYDIFKYIDTLLLNMRKDLGVNNEGLEQYDIIQTLIIDDIKKIISENEKSLKNK